jgi:WD40 repeat protein
VVIRVHTPTTLPGANRYVLSALGSLEMHRPKEARRPPEELVGMTLPEYLRGSFSTRGAGSGAAFQPTVLIIDQFEEILTVDPTDTGAKAEFFRQLGAVLADRERWILIAMREDHLAALDPFLHHLPNRLDARYRLDRLGPGAALDAIISPADRAVGAGEKERGVGFQIAAAEQLVSDLRLVRVQQPDNTFDTKPGPYVEPVHLQVVCKSLWEMKENRTRSDPVSVDDIKALGGTGAGGGPDGNLIGVDWVLAQYYRRKVKEAADQGKVGERRIRDWFEKRLITLTRSRQPVQRGEDEQYGITPAARDVLDHAYLIREDIRGGTHWLELAHDRLIAPVLRDNVSWRLEKLHPFQRDAVIWHETGQVGAVLGGSVLKEAEQWAAAHPDLLSPEDREFLDKSREHAEQVRKRYIGIGLGVLAGVVAVVVTLIAASWRAGKQQAASAQREQVIQAQLWFSQVQRTQAQQQRDRREQASALRARVQDLVAREQRGRTGPDLAEEALSLLARAEKTRPNPIELPDAEALLRRTLQSVRARPSRDPLEGAVRVIAISPSGKWAVIGSEKGYAQMYDLARGSPSDQFGTLFGYDGGMTAAAFTPAEDYLVLSKPDKTLLGVKPGSNFEDPQRYLDLLGTRSTIRSLRIGSPGRDRDAWIATIGSDGTGSLFRWKSGTPPISIEYVGRREETKGGVPPSTRPAAVTSVEFTPNKLYAGTTDGHVYAWDLEQEIPVPIRMNAIVTDTAITALAVHPRARFLAVGTFRPNLELWSLDPKKPISDSVTNRAAALPTPAVESILVHHTGRWLAAVSREQTVRLFRNRNEETQPPAYEPVTLGLDRKEWVFGPEFSGRATVVTFDTPDDRPDGRSRELFLAGYPDGTTRLWDLSRTGQAPFTLPGHQSGVTSVAIHPQQTFALIGYQDGTVTVWDIGAVLGGADAEPRVLLGPTAQVTWVSVSPDGRWYFARDMDGGVVRCSLDPTGAPPLRVSWKGVLAAVAAEGQSALVLSVPKKEKGPLDLTVSHWSPPSNGSKPIGVVPLPDMPLALAISEDRSLLAVLDEKGTRITLVKLSPLPVVVGSLGIPASLKQEETKRRPTGDLALSADGRVLACAVGPKVFAWRLDPATGAPTAPTTLSTSTDNDDIFTLAMSRDGQRIAAGEVFGTIRVWDNLEDRPRVRALYGHQKYVTALAFAEDGNRLASGSADTTARVWDLRSASSASTVLSGHTDAITALAMTPTDPRAETRVVTTGADGTVRVWTLDRVALMKRAEKLVEAVRPHPVTIPPPAK